MKELLLRIAKMVGPMLLVGVKMIGSLILLIAIDFGLLIYDKAFYYGESTYIERITLIVVMMIYFKDSK